MTTFIEVTSARTGNSFLLNVAAIERLMPLGDGSRILFIGGTAAQDPNELDVSEAYAVLRGRLHIAP